MAEKDGSYYKNDEKLSTGQSLAIFIWNPRTREFCGRTGSSWLKILVFYIIFYLCLAAFWAVMLLIFYQTINPQVPKWQLGESRIGTNPGLGFRPRPKEDNIDSTLIWFKSGETTKSWEHWSNNLVDFLKPYEKNSANDAGAHLAECKGTSDSPNNTEKFCRFDVEEAYKIESNCSKANSFGYKRGDPCVIIKLNRIYNWRPEQFTAEDVENLPEEVKQLYGKNQKKIFITCEGENAADRENIGTIGYSPEQGIDFKYFPFTNQPGYLSPFVFVHFRNPTPGVLINIECKAWAKNIKHDRMDREGSVHFELLIDGF